jgi:hypothetical protein
MGHCPAVHGNPSLPIEKIRVFCIQSTEYTP